MAKDKLRRFAEFKTFHNTFEFPYELKGKWNQQVFKNDHPIVLELGCGKGEYTVNLAKEYPEKNFIGIDIKSNRMWIGAGIANRESITNAAFARMVIHKINEVFEAGEVSEIWITFPDPFPKDRHAKHRLTHPRFLRLYQQILKKGGLVNFKTDDPGLFHFTVEMLPQIGVNAIITDWDVHHNPNADRHLKEIRTHYENLFMQKGRTIKFTQFTLDAFDEKLGHSFEAHLDEQRKKGQHLELN
jgi:tRNA (guanine-N7-)-methyltransferase